MEAKSETDRLIGIDVSKARVDVHVRPDGTAFYCTTDTEGLVEPTRRLTPLRPRLVVGSGVGPTGKIASTSRIASQAAPC